jgi:hypothetical protein
MLALAAWLLLVPAEVGNPVPADVAVDSDAPPLMSDAELRALAERDVAAARPVLRRAARTASSPATRALGLRLLTTWDPSTATARICARALRLDADGFVRRSGAECLGRLGPRLASSYTPSLVAALKDPVVDVVTMAGWALANVGDAPAISDVGAVVGHPDVRVQKLFRGYTERMRERLGLTYASASPSAPAVEAGAPTALPPGVAITLPARGLDQAASTGWLGVYGVMTGWVNGPLLLSAHGGAAGAGASSLGALGLGAVTGAALAGYGYARADSLPLAHTVVQLGTFGSLAGYGAGQFVGTAPISGVASANLTAAGTLVGTGIGMALVEVRPPSMGALAAGMSAGVLTGFASGTLGASYGFGFDNTLGAILLTSGVAGGATTVLLGDADIGLFPTAGATLGGLVVGGVGAVVASAVEGNDGSFSERGGWIVLSSVALGSALGGVGGALLPRDADPLLAGTLRLNPPSLALLQPVIPSTSTAPVPVAVVTGSF